MGRNAGKWDDVVICGNCGKVVEMHYYNKEDYIYTTTRKVGNDTKRVYFCGHRCRNEALRKYAEEAEQKKRAVVEKRLETMRKKKEAKDET